MNLHITSRAVACLKEEWEFADGDDIKIYVRYTGGGEEPLALGIMKEPPSPSIPIDRVTAGGMTFYMERDDQWFLEGRTLTIDASGDQIRFILGDDT
jgi:uncharacterized protein YneR